MFHCVWWACQPRWMSSQVLEHRKLTPTSAKPPTGGIPYLPYSLPARLHVSFSTPGTLMRMGIPHQILQFGCTTNKFRAHTRIADVESCLEPCSHFAGAMAKNSCRITSCAPPVPPLDIIYQSAKCDWGWQEPGGTCLCLKIYCCTCSLAWPLMFLFAQVMQGTE
jgi:hypothetical protein